MYKPTDIDFWTESENLVQVRNWAMWGASAKEIAERMGIDQKTLNAWREEEPLLEQAIRNSQNVADSFVEDALFEKATNGDNNAMQFWLKNRHPERWGASNKSHEELESIKLDNEIKQQKLLDMQRGAEQSSVVTYTGIPADLMAPPFLKMHHQVRTQEKTEFILPGGRGSTKSSWVSLEVIDLIMKHPTTHAVVCRMVGDTLRNSVFTQIQWAIDKLGLNDEFSTKLVPLEITRKSTGQKIYFRGCDDAGKLKSIQVPFGSISILWFEELDQYKGSEFVRKVEQSVIRGSDDAWIFKSFNPPRSKMNWANEYTTEAKFNKDSAVVVESTYLDVPQEWLGKPFIEQAEWLKENNLHAYENEYLGVANGSGGNVFENVIPRTISDEEIKSFDRVANGVDFGWFPDPWHFARIQYNPGQSQLIIFDERRGTKLSNSKTANIIKGIIPEGELVVCDNEPKSISDYINEGLKARGAIKGTGSREYGYKWLASLNEIIIDPVRCPATYKEFTEYEYERDANNEIISGYPDGNDHSIDAVRYATEQFSKRHNTIKVG